MCRPTELYTYTLKASRVTYVGPALGYLVALSHNELSKIYIHDLISKTPNIRVVLYYQII